MHRADVDGVDEEEGEYEFDDVQVDHHASTFTLVVGLSIAFSIICALSGSCLLMRERLRYAWRVWNAGSSAVRRTKSMVESSGARRPQRLQDEHADDSGNISSA